MRLLLPASAVVLTLASPAAVAADRECYETYTPYCREKFTADNLPVLHKPDPTIPRDAFLIGEIDRHIAEAKALDGPAMIIKERLKIINKPPKDADENPITESDDAKTSRLEQVLADHKQLRQIEAKKYAAYNAAIEKTTDLYHLKPKITAPIGHSQMAASPMRPWAPRFSDNEKYVRDPATDYLMGRRLNDDENRAQWKRRGIIINGPAVPPALGAGTARDDARIAIFYGAFSSRDNLASKIYHETVHWLDRNARGRAPNPDEHFESEIRAYQKEIDSQKVFSLDANAVKQLRQVQNIYLLQKNTPGSISWGELEDKHPDWLKGSNLSNFPQLEPGKPEPLKAGGELAFLDGIATGDIQDAAADLRRRQDERHQELQKWAQESDAWENRQKKKAQLMAEIDQLRAENDRKFAAESPRRSQLYVMALAAEACANPARLPALAEEGKIIRVDIALDAASYEAGDSLSGCQRDILDKFDAARRGSSHVTSHDFIRWAHFYRVSHPSFVKKLANAFTGFFEIFESLFEGSEGTSEVSREDSRSVPSDSGCFYTHIPEINTTVRGCPVN